MARMNVLVVTGSGGNEFEEDYGPIRDTAGFRPVLQKTPKS